MSAFVGANVGASADTGIRTVYVSPALHIEAVSVSTVKTLGSDRFNNNNCWPASVRPVDYDDVLARGNTSNWIDRFKQHYIVINIDAKERAWMRKAAAIGYKTGRVSDLFLDEMETLLARHKETDVFFAHKTPYFVRSESVSLKYGCHGVGPYFDLRCIVESMLTSIEGHSPLDDAVDAANAASSIKLYLLPWQTITRDREFRVFIHNNRVSAISQQHLYRVNALLAALPTDAERTVMIESWVRQIVAYHDTVLRTKLADMHSYSMDIAILDDGSSFFIEPNCYGAAYAAGSALYHWIIDQSKLNATASRVYFRFTERGEGGEWGCAPLTPSPPSL